MRLPKYVRLGKGCALRLIKDNPKFFQRKNTYYRDGGNWDINYKIKGEKLFSVSYIKHLDNIELIKVTKKEWWKDNVPYFNGGS